MTDYAARRESSVFKPAIDAALLRIARRRGAEEALAPALAALSVPTGTGPWGYLMLAIDAARPHRLDQAIPEHEWARYFLAGSHREYVGHSTHRDEDDDGDGYLDVGYYPPEAKPALKQEAFVGGHDSDVVLLWTREDGHHTVCHAHPEGFWILGQDPIDFIERAAQLSEGAKPAPIRDPEVEALAAAPVEHDAADDEEY